ncbi:hypothetical protein BZA05DRAFT_12780 [Tricharina praecox]|uniref:uncharacterized protein n=1 Tax=Tricharina praecox TaxID=43433 RepID=UPI00221FE89A|nr:uncharacterized protein BZA05DRAFT_12780 [Tricharina praecox]KAI5858764.1 hypothetical protein BZA05DRAFT_12780 [Tricharina praecox]
MVVLVVVVVDYASCFVFKMVYFFSHDCSLDILPCFFIPTTIATYYFHSFACMPTRLIPLHSGVGGTTCCFLIIYAGRFLLQG